MIQKLMRCTGLKLERLAASTLLFSALLFQAAAEAQKLMPDLTATRSSVSGQFVVISANKASLQDHPSATITNTGFVRLEPALLAVSAERIKQTLWRRLGLDPSSPWYGRIFLALHPPASPDENVAIITTRFAGTWNCRVELPDVLSRTRLTRALTGAVLLELANRDNSGDHSAEIPAWLTEGLAQQLLASGPEMVVSSPDKLLNGVPESQITVVERGVDAFAQSRPILHDNLPLTFEQLSWPDDAQLSGDDGGVFRANAQLFVSDLLQLDDGPKNVRAMLQMLPRYYNWQTAFYDAFAVDFPQPVDLEKWWAVQTVSFAAHDAGPLWTPVVSRDKLDEILSVPVEMRSAPTNLPVHAAISLQAVIRNFDFDRQRAALKVRLRDLQLAQWRMAPQFVALTDAYYRTLAEYLGGHNGVAPSKNTSEATLKKLDALDAQRRAMETASQPDVLANQLK